MNLEFKSNLDLLKSSLSDFNSFQLNIKMIQSEGALSTDQQNQLFNLLNYIRRLAYIIQIDLVGYSQVVDIPPEELSVIQQNYITFEEDLMPDMIKAKDFIIRINNIYIRQNTNLINKNNSEKASGLFSTPKL